MKYLYSLLFLLSAFCANAQQVIYDENAELRSVAEFNAIEIGGAIRVYITQDDAHAVAISAGDEKYNTKIKTEVKDGVLLISVDGGVWNTFSLADKKLKAYVSLPQLNRLVVSGASYAILPENMKAGNLLINVSGASEVKGGITADKLNLNISGASVARLKGIATDALVEASGASKISSYELVTGNLKINASGASSTRISVSGNLSAEASGGATIYYRGQPAEVTSKASAGATIKMRGD